MGCGRVLFVPRPPLVINEPAKIGATPLPAFLIRTDGVTLVPGRGTNHRLPGIGKGLKLGVLEATPCDVS